MDPSIYEKSASSIRQKIPADSPLQKPKWAIVCGSGLSGLSDTLLDPITIPYQEIEGFPETTVAGHKSLLVFGYLSSKRIPIVAQVGRYHAYEGKPLNVVTFPMRVFSCLGVEKVLLTNAAGGLNPTYNVPTIVALHGHFSVPSLTSMNPLIGPNMSEFGPRFPPTSDAYDFNLRKAAFVAAKQNGLPDDMVTEGTYAWVAGPTYESPAEGRFLTSAGADVVGMSTVPEVIVARHCGMRVLALSLVTNMVVVSPYRSAKAAVQDDCDREKSIKYIPDEVKESTANHEEVLEEGKKAADSMMALVQKIVEIETM